MNHQVRRFQPADRDAMIHFARALPEHDLLFLERDLGEPRVVEAWLAAVAKGWIDSFVAIEDADDAAARLAGTAALIRDPHGFSAHVGEVRLLVDPGRRGHGLGRDLIETVFAAAHAHGLAKLTAQMTPDQTASVALFESLGFAQEARLRDQVRGRDGVSHDLVILACAIARRAG